MVGPWIILLWVTKKASTGSIQVAIFPCDFIIFEPKGAIGLF